VLEPMQRRSGGERLTVARHVEDLHALVRARQSDQPALVGHSWGAMLALAYAAAHPGCASRLVLVGCGTFDRASRQELRRTIDERMDPDARRRIAGLAAGVPDPDERLGAWGRLLAPLHSFDADLRHLEIGACDAEAHHQSWSDMRRLQDNGTYPAAFSTIDVPVVMLHGEADPHPGWLIHASLEPYVRQLEFVEIARCGHYPWLERHAHEEFLTHLRRSLEDPESA
jgi:pimeloyl-ACP methyl ester carboxylesterase